MLYASVVFSSGKAKENIAGSRATAATIYISELLMGWIFML
jgi:hypothetical protein